MQAEINESLLLSIPGVDDFELEQVSSEFQSALERADLEHHLFDAPSTHEVVRLADSVARYTRAAGWMAQATARDRVEHWKSQARAQALISGHPNAGKVVLSLFDHTGNWSRPWEEAGYSVFRFDIQDNPITGDVTEFGAGFFGDYFGDFEGLEVYAVLAACPCTEFATSGARHFAAKDADGRTVAAVELVHQTLRTIEYYRPSVWAIENPVGRIEKLSGLPPWRLSFDPCHLGDPYTKKTLIWGRFNGNLPIAPVEPVDGSKMHKKFGGKSAATKNARSETPEGFAYGFFLANNALDNPVLAISGKYDRLDSSLLRHALAVGMTPNEISTVIDDAYYDMDDEAAKVALRNMF
ncbi:DNA cytosine methyltransferase [Pseudomonas sp. LPH60]|uniref:DNA cytosine methyltransferase n=1 Tax=Pseudomonas sp. LPH60 TaxID=3065906 RepID=UPI00273C2B6C|nr:DNA cytosine methyltransferase [Pseudomonas sp. LPH60]MDP4573481.1 DNA cytosine methyltransferase [Pseudomonas sp. LPH60]